MYLPDAALASRPLNASVPSAFDVAARQDKHWSSPLPTSDPSADGQVRNRLEERSQGRNLSSSVPESLPPQSGSSDALAGRPLSSFPHPCLRGIMETQQRGV